jgi:60 kDa SS-A/Ro ribonucleoprotein
MTKMNVWKRMLPVRTHEGAVAQKVRPKLELRRTVLTCLPWEDTFYEKGSGIAARVAELVRVHSIGSRRKSRFRLE